MENNGSIGVTLSQSVRSCGNNCPPNMELVGKARRSFKIRWRKEYKRYLIALKYMKLNSMQEQVFCPL